MQDHRDNVDPHAEIELMGAAYTALSHIDTGRGQRAALNWLTARLESDWRRAEEIAMEAALAEAEEAGLIESV